ncbi:hypothetical protein PIB30_020723 [Stylosanthes scabra]|uniref:Leucine-rich repeat-containing N-terminal plant-type domain-containing protein n=1 Tax=Stylosanthes scabra TaxID=79078 RepID=A0ABU6Y906_9FABA|nr:hypothetical protein [Stylosanthes scabra]
MARRNTLSIIFFFVVAEIAQVCLCANSSSIPCIERERQTLLEFKASLNYDPTNRLSSWEGVHCCQWEGVGCDYLTSRVVKLDLSNLPYNTCWRSLSKLYDDRVEIIEDQCEDLNRPVGAPYVSSSLLQLEYLTYLDLSGNDFYGSSIPTFIASMQRLTYLSLSDAEFDGKIPSSFGNLTNMRFLDLGHNDYDYNYDSQALDMDWISELQSLEYLDMSNVYIGDGTYKLFQVLNMLPSLSSIYLDDCGIQILPLINVTNAPKLQALSLQLNEFTVSILHFQNMTSLLHLDLSGNNLTSPPSWFGNFKKLEYLDLSYCGLSQIPDAFRNITSIEHLYLSGNNLESLPSLFCKFEKLKHFILSSNGFRGSIPDAIRNLTSIEMLGLSSNYLTSIPFWLVELKTLLHLDVSRNELMAMEYSISSIIRNMCQLRGLYLSENKLKTISNGSNEFPTSTQYDLEIMDLSDNQVSEHLPSWLGLLENLNQFVGLSYLNLSSNNLNGTIVIGNLSSKKFQLCVLDLSANQISGSLPEHIGYAMPTLEYLHLGNNFINGSIPSSLCHPALSILDLSKNRLSGKIPNCWKDNQIWESIDLSSNNLSGAIPSTLGNLSTLYWLHLNNNSLQGEIPVLERKMDKLLILDVGENKLSGSIPSSIADTFPELQILRMPQNMLSGSMPSQLCQLSSLKILDLSKNKLGGSIPWCIGNMRGMILNISAYHSTVVGTSADPPVEEQWPTEDVNEVMKGRELDYIRILKLVVIINLSENKLVGDIPEGITLLTGLHGLNLSHNHLNGNIPNMIGDMKSLESLDVSNNQLSGTIPSSISAITSLSRLNLSHNNLSGPIPTENQFSTFEASTYVGNPYLCGLPLPNSCSSNSSSQGPGDEENGTRDKLEKWGFYFVVAAGFATGFWGIIGLLYLKKNWRHACFKRMEDVADWIYVEVAVTMRKLKKQSVRSQVHG